MRFLPVALLGLASVAVADINNWSDLVGTMPKCTKTCLDDYYKDLGFEKKCGKADDADTKCLCGIKDIKDLQGAAMDLSKCMQKGCSASDLSDVTSDLEGFQDRVLDFANQCNGSSSSDDDDDSDSARKGGGSSSGNGGGSSSGSNSAAAANNSDSGSGDDDDGDDTSGAGSLAPGFNAMLASGALLLAGAAL